ncbi:MAG TPA: hypothetical protein VHH34_07575, partial [Pseudonocardiaceae bacterium]|nr:hypothetical protein [Pseudonocardiaceae bacterium]
MVEIRTLLVDLAREHGVTVLLSSHLLSEVARVATRVGVLHHGRLVDEFGADALAAQVQPRLEVGARDTARAARSHACASFGRGRGSVIVVSEAGTARSAACSSETAISAIRGSGGAVPAG